MSEGKMGEQTHKSCLALKNSDHERCTRDLEFDPMLKGYPLVCWQHNDIFLTELKNENVSHSMSKTALESAYSNIRDSRTNRKTHRDAKHKITTLNAQSKNSLSTSEFFEILKITGPVFIAVATFYNYFLYNNRFNYFDYANLTDISIGIFNPKLLIGVLIPLLIICWLRDRFISLKSWINQKKLLWKHVQIKSATGAKKQTIQSKIDELNNKGYVSTYGSLNNIKVALEVFAWALAFCALTMLVDRWQLDNSQTKFFRFVEGSQDAGSYSLVKAMNEYFVLEKAGDIHVLPREQVESISHNPQSPSKATQAVYINLDNSLPTLTSWSSNRSSFQTVINLGGKEVFVGNSTLLLPFFTGEVKPDLGATNEDGKIAGATERKMKVFSFAAEENLSTVSIKDDSKDIKYFSHLQNSLIACAKNAEKDKGTFKIDIFGFASSDPFTGNESKELNHILAEGRRAAIIEALGFNENGVINGAGSEKVLLMKGREDENSILYQDLKSGPKLEKFISQYGFKFKDYDEMQANLIEQIGVGTPVDESSPAVEQAFSRSAAIVIPSGSMKYCTH